MICPRPVHHVQVQCFVFSSFQPNHMLTLSLYNNSASRPPSHHYGEPCHSNRNICCVGAPAEMTHSVVFVGWTTSLRHISYTDDWINFVCTACIPSTASSLTTQLTCLLYKATAITNTGNSPYQPPPATLLMLIAAQRTVWQHVLSRFHGITIL